MNLLYEILAGLKHNKMRTALTGLSVSWGIFILIILLGAGNGLMNGVTSNYSQRASNAVLLYSERTSIPYRGLKSDRRLYFSEKELDVLGKMKDVSDETGIINIPSNIVMSYKSEYGNFSVSGVEPVYEKIHSLKFAPGDGRFINALDMKNLSKVIVLDQKVAETLFKNENPLGKYVKLGNIMFRVIGVNSKKARWGNGSAYIPFSIAQKIYNPNKKFWSLAMLANDLKTMEENKQFSLALRTALGASMNFSPDDTKALWIYNSQERYIETMKTFGAINIFVLIIGILTLIAGIVGVSNIMFVSVKERTREIGIRKAIGATPANILRSIIAESIIITSIFGYFGMIAGMGITEIANIIMEQSAAGNPEGMTVFRNPTVGLDYVLASMAILIISGIIAGYMPARRAVKVKPIEAMRDE